MSSTNEVEAWGVSNLRLAFPEKQEMFFKDLNFHYHRGEKILFLGPSGCGKSTLLQVLSGLIPKSVRLPMKAEAISIPESWGYIFQDPDTQFCMPYVDEEIAFVLENRKISTTKMPELIQKYLTMVGLDLADPHQLIHSLSGGMKQRLAIAGVLALEPDVLFLDEPTALLDPEGTVQLWQTVRKIGMNRTLIIVEHKISHIMNLVDRVVLFDNKGHIIADGPTSDIIRHHRRELDDYGIWHPDAWASYENRYSGDSLAKTAGKPILKLKNFSVFRGKTVKFSVPDLTIREGEWIAIIGENGAGKSTMIEGIMNLIRHRGSCHWFLKHPEKDAAFVFQNPEYQFVTDRVEEELAFSLVQEKMAHDQIASRVEQELVRYSLEAQRDQNPFQLSVGQKRRLSVASSLIDQPEAVILDEPTFGQDARNTFSLLDLFRKLVENGTSVIMVTHEMEIVRRFATRVLTIKQGRLIGDSRVADQNSGREGEPDGQLVEEHR